MPNAVVLLSGGLDSATVLALARRDGFACHALTIAYGQRHAVEVEAAARVASALGAAGHKTLRLDLRAFGGSALTADLAVPQGRSEGEMAQGIPITYVPARNTVFLSLALAYAETLEAFDIYLGVNAVDYSGYPDCRPEFVRAFEALANLATKAGAEGGRFSIRAPPHRAVQGRHHPPGDGPGSGLRPDPFLLRSRADRLGVRDVRFVPDPPGRLRRRRRARSHLLRGLTPRRGGQGRASPPTSSGGRASCRGGWPCPSMTRIDRQRPPR